MRRRLVCGLALGFIGFSSLHAADMSGEAAIGAIYTDNIRLAPANTATDTIDVASTHFLLHEESRRIDADVAGDLQYLNYEHDIYSSQLIGNFTGYGKLALLPGRIDWVAQDNFGQQQINPGTPVTPQNLENINYLSTGPELTLPLGSQLSAQLSGRYSKVSYQLHDFDNDRTDGSFALVHALTASSNASLNVSTEHVNYDGDIATAGFTTRLGYLHYDLQGARSKLSVDAGYDDATIMGTKSGGGLVRAQASRSISASSTLELSAGQVISDTSNLLRQMQGVSNVGLGPAALQRSDDPFTSRYGRAAWRFERHRTALDVALSQFRETHIVETNLDRTRTEIDADARRNLSQALTLNVLASFARDTYTEAITPGDSEIRASADLAWQIGRHLAVHVQYAHIDHRSDAPIDAYTENRIMLTVGLAGANHNGLTTRTPGPGDMPGY